MSTTVKGHDLSDSQYKQLKADLKKQGMNIEDGTGKLDMQGAFNQMSDNDKQKIADSFDSLLDLKLKDDIMKVMEECGVNRYIDLLKNKKCTDKLKAMGIVVQAIDQDGKVIKDPKASTRNWQISRVDKDGNVIKDENGKLEQFKWKDFNSDSYIQGAEANVNELLAAAGFDCVTKLGLDAEGKAKLANIQGMSSDIGIGETSSASQTNDPTKPFNIDTMFFTEKEQKEDSREEISLSEFEQKIQELITNDGLTRTEAEAEIANQYKYAGMQSLQLSA